MPAIYYAKTRAVKEGQIMDDEMTHRTAGESARISFAIMVPVMAVLSIILIYGGDDIGNRAESAGYTLSVAVMALVLVFTATAAPIRKKLVS